MYSTLADHFVPAQLMQLTSLTAPSMQIDHISSWDCSWSVAAVQSDFVKPRFLKCPSIWDRYLNGAETKPRDLGGQLILGQRINGSGFIMIFVDFVLLIMFPFCHHCVNILCTLTVCTLNCCCTLCTLLSMYRFIYIYILSNVQY